MEAGAALLRALSTGVEQLYGRGGGQPSGGGNEAKHTVYRRS